MAAEKTLVSPYVPQRSHTTPAQVDTYQKLDLLSGHVPLRDTLIILSDVNLRPAWHARQARPVVRWYMHMRAYDEGRKE